MKHISYSQVSLYTSCPKKYQFRYVDKIEKPIPDFFRRGRAVHSAQEHNYRQKIESEIDLPIDEVLDFAAQESEEDVRDEVIDLVAMYHIEVAPTIQPVFVEERLEIPIGDKTLVGIIDLVDTDGHIHDTKTTKRRPAENIMEFNLQSWIYSLLCREVLGEEGDVVSFDYLVQKKVPEVVIRRASVGDLQRAKALSILEVVGEEIDRGVFYPNYGFLCSSCEYKKECLEGI